jgi:hypothetical protein
MRGEGGTCICKFVGMGGSDVLADVEIAAAEDAGIVVVAAAAVPVAQLDEGVEPSRGGKDHAAWNVEEPAALSHHHDDRCLKKKPTDECGMLTSGGHEVNCKSTVLLHDLTHVISNVITSCSPPHSFSGSGPVAACTSVVVIITSSDFYKKKNNEMSETGWLLEVREWNLQFTLLPLSFKIVGGLFCDLLLTFKKGQQ